MTQREPARLQVQPSPEQTRATRETLERLGVPDDTQAQDSQQSGAELESTDLTQSSVQPAAGLLHELHGSTDRLDHPREERNNRDSDADVLPQ